MFFMGKRISVTRTKCKAKKKNTETKEKLFFIPSRLQTTLINFVIGR